MINNFRHRIQGNAIQQSQINEEKESYYQKDDQYEYVYFNLFERNNSKVNPINGVLDQASEITKNLTFDITRTANIIDGDTDDWEVAVISYSCPNGFQIFNSVSRDIEYEGIHYYGDPLHYVYVKDTQTGNLIIKYVDYQGINGGSPKIYDYSLIVRAINNSIKTICDEFGIVQGPFYKINSNNVYEYWATDQFSGIGRYKLGVSYSVYNQLSCFEYYVDLEDKGGFNFYIYSLLDKGHEQRIYNNENWTVMSQLWDPRYIGGGYSRLVFKSDIPITNEKFASIEQISDGILIDRILIDRLADNRAFNYFPEFPIWHNMINSKNFRKFNLSGFIERLDGTLDPLRIQPYFTFFMKLCFRRPLKK